MAEVSHKIGNSKTIHVVVIKIEVTVIKKHIISIEAKRFKRLNTNAHRFSRITQLELHTYHQNVK